MSHDYHPALPDFVPEAVFHSGCSECEHRAGLGFEAIAMLDNAHLRQAMNRAQRLEVMGGRRPGEAGDRMLVDPIELPLLRDLALVGVIAQRLGWTP